MSLPRVPTRARPHTCRGAVTTVLAVVAVLLAALAGLPGAAPRAVAAPEVPDAPTDGTTIGGPQLASTGVVAPSGTPALPEGVNATGWLVADADSGTVLAARNAHGKYLPASTLKTLTALTLLPRLKDRNQVVVATDDDANVDGTRVGLVPSGRYPVDMLFYCMLMMSGNDCANALAEAAGGVSQTVSLMNTEARRLHALDTHAATPSGLDGPQQATSAYDLALILRQDIAQPDFQRYNSTRQGTVPAQPPKYGSYKFNNDNVLLWNYQGTLAAKNGYTDAARHTYVAAAKHGSRTLIVTLMHGERSPVDMWEQASRLLDWGFSVPASSTGVGELVSPDNPNQKHSISSAESSPAAGAAAKEAQTAASNRSLWDPRLWGAVLAGVVVLALLALVFLRRRRTD